MKIEFKICKQSDFSDLLEMMENFYAIDGYLFNRDNTEKNLLEFTQNLELGRAWIIHLDDSIIGYVILSFGYSFEFGGKDAFIDELFIKKDLRNKGIGKATLQFVNEEAKKIGVNAIHLEVENHNERASKLYLNNGYKGNKRALLTKRIE